MIVSNHLSLLDSAVIEAVQPNFMVSHLLALSVFDFAQRGGLFTMELFTLTFCDPNYVVLQCGGLKLVT